MGGFGITHYAWNLSKINFTHMEAHTPGFSAGWPGVRKAGCCLESYELSTENAESGAISKQTLGFFVAFVLSAVDVSVRRECSKRPFRGNY